MTEISRIHSDVYNNIYYIHTWLKSFIGSLSIDKLNSSFLLDPYKFYSLTVSVHSAWDHPQKWAIQLNCPVGGSTGQLHLVLLRGGPLGIDLSIKGQPTSALIHNFIHSNYNRWICKLHKKPASTFMPLYVHITF